jgi:hypothetical protein
MQGTVFSSARRAFGSSGGNGLGIRRHGVSIINSSQQLVVSWAV